MNFYIGTSGYQYRHWNDGVFYPPGTVDQLEYIYAKLNCVEINSSHYSAPKPETVARWASKVPDGSKMILKCPRSVSHRRRMALVGESDESLEIRQGIDYMDYFLDGYSRIPREKQGPVLVQINDRLSFNADRLQGLLRYLSFYGFQCAFEARHESWFRKETFDLLEKYDSALVAHDWDKFKCPLIATTDFVYVRNHGPKRYTDSYSDEMLEAELSAISAHKVDDAYVLFNNDGGGAAPRDAVRMIKMIGEMK